MQEVLHSQNLKGETFMKRFTIAIVLACVFSVPALAGAIPCDYTPPPPPPPPEELQASPGEIPTGGVTGAIPSDGFTQQAEDAMVDGLLAVVGWLT
jgi:hypothetical protein